MSREKKESDNEIRCEHCGKVIDISKLSDNEFLEFIEKYAVKKSQLLKDFLKKKQKNEINSQKHSDE